MLHPKLHNLILPYYGLYTAVALYKLLQATSGVNTLYRITGISDDREIKRVRWFEDRQEAENYFLQKQDNLDGLNFSFRRLTFLTGQPGINQIWKTPDDWVYLPLGFGAARRFTTQTGTTGSNQTASTQADWETSEQNSVECIGAGAGGQTSTSGSG